LTHGTTGSGPDWNLTKEGGTWMNNETISKERIEELRKQVPEILAEFDFEKVKLVMQTLNWNYLDGPAADRVCALAVQHLEELLNHAEHGWTGLNSGGIQSELFQDESGQWQIWLKFIVESGESV
jgi:hypothetical protein